MVRYVKATEMPSTATGKVAALRMPLVFDPGDKWNTASTSTGSAVSSRRSAGRRSTSISATRSSPPLA